MKKRLVHDPLQLLHQICFQGCSLHTIFRPEPMECVMKRQTSIETILYHRCADLPNHLNKPYTRIPLPPPSFWKKKPSFLCHLLRHHPVLKSLLVESYQQPPPMCHWFFSLEASCNHPFRSSAFMPDGQPALPLLRPRNACTTFSFHTLIWPAPVEIHLFCLYVIQFFP